MNTLSPEEIVRLTAPERLALIGDLWNSLNDTDLPLTSQQTAELQNRLAGFDNDRPQAMTWEMLRAQLAKRPS